MERSIPSGTMPSILVACFLLLALACSGPPPAMTEPDVGRNLVERDVHSYSNPHEVGVHHLDLDLDVRFDERKLVGSVTLSLHRVRTGAETLVLDTRDLIIHGVENTTGDDGTFEAAYQLGETDPVLGAPLSITLEPGTTHVRVRYETRPTASALQWLAPEQTSGKQQPFMFTQSQAIHARSWIPLQDSPGVRVTYSARVRTPSTLRAVMSAANDPAALIDGDYTFHMGQPVPSYLIALAVGDLGFENLGPRAGVYAEPAILSAAAAEFADTEAMIAATERLYGPYRWVRYDLLVLPPSFPFGGMENPRLTFATPTILAGDKSLVSLVAHELAHSWSGNLVTNATWRDFWLNEGFTTYIERRIIEEVYGPRRAEMEAVLGYQVLKDELERLDDADAILHVDLTGRDPDDGMTQVPYEKGALFLRSLEEAVGRDRFDQFLRAYFDRFAFQSITTNDFLSQLQTHLLDDPGGPASVDHQVVTQWIDEPGLPATAPQPQSDALTLVEQAARDWLQGQTLAEELPTSLWSTHEWLHFLTILPVQLTQSQLEDLDGAFSLTDTGNAEIAHAWLLIAIRNEYAAADARLRTYLTEIGRRKLIRPLYEALATSPSGRELALAIYREARPGYHPISTDTIDKLLAFDR